MIKPFTRNIANKNMVYNKHRNKQSHHRNRRPKTIPHQLSLWREQSPMKAAIKKQEING